jgi:hypothetical protein
MADTQQIGLVIIGILLGYVIAGMKGALIGGLIGFSFSYLKRFIL